MYNYDKYSVSLDNNPTHYIGLGLLGNGINRLDRLQRLDRLKRYTESIHLFEAPIQQVYIGHEFCKQIIPYQYK